jgi:hypothetical protein
LRGRSSPSHIGEAAYNMKTRWIIIFSALIFSNAIAQELGIAPVKIWTNNYEIQDPVGVGLSISKTIWRVKFRAEYLYANNERTYSGYISYGFMIYPLPNIENVKSTSSLSAYEFSVSFPILFYNSNSCLNLGFGYSFDTYSADRIGLTSWKMVSFGNVLKSGPFFISSIDYSLFLSLKLEFTYKLKSLSNGPFATDVELPFMNIATVHVLQLIVLYKLF